MLRKYALSPFEERRSPRSRVVALAGLFDLDDARAHVGEQHRAVRTREHAGQIEDGDAGEWSHVPRQWKEWRGNSTILGSDGAALRSRSRWSLWRPRRSAGPSAHSRSDDRHHRQRDVQRAPDQAFVAAAVESRAKSPQDAQRRTPQP